MPVDIGLIRASIEGSGNTPSTPRGWNDRANLAALCDEVEATRRAVGDLLAVLLGDGGHRQAEVGTVQAAEEALERVHAMQQALAERRHAHEERAAVVAYLRAVLLPGRADPHAVADEIEAGLHRARLGRLP